VVNSTSHYELLLGAKGLKTLVDKGLNLLMAAMGLNANLCGDVYDLFSAEGIL
jgi:hypothetical protein